MLSLPSGADLVVRDYVRLGYGSSKPIIDRKKRAVWRVLRQRGAGLARSRSDWRGHIQPIGGDCGCGPDGVEPRMCGGLHGPPPLLVARLRHDAGMTSRL